MRRIIGAVAMATLVGVGLGALPAAGLDAGGRDRSVEFTGTSTFDFGSADCSFAHQVFDATLETRRGATLDIEGCVELIDATTFPFAGTFTIEVGHRAVTGTVSGSLSTPTTNPCTSGVPAGIDLELTPAAPGRPRDALQLDGIWCSAAVPGVPGTISGTLTGALPPGVR